MISKALIVAVRIRITSGYSARLAFSLVLVSAASNPAKLATTNKASFSMQSFWIRRKPETGGWLVRTKVRLNNRNGDECSRGIHDRPADPIVLENRTTPVPQNTLSARKRWPMQQTPVLGIE